MQSVNQPFMHNLKPLFAAWEAVRGWSEWVLIAWKQAEALIGELSVKVKCSRWSSFYNKYISCDFGCFNNYGLFKNLEWHVLKVAESHTKIAAIWGKFAPNWDRVQQVAATEKIAVDATVKEAKMYQEMGNQAFDFSIQFSLEHVVAAVANAVAKTKTLSAFLETTWMMTQAWISTTIENIGNMATVEFSVQRKKAALSQLQSTNLFQIHSATVSEMEEMTSIAESVMIAAKSTTSAMANMERIAGMDVNAATMSTTEIEETLAVMNKLRSTTIPTLISTCETTVQSLQILKNLSYATDSHIQ
jgi:hypothetical protein